MRRAVLIGIVLGVFAAPAAAAAQFAPVDQPGPPLSVPQSQLNAALNCTSDVDNASTTPVLLVPATGVNPHANYSWNWLPYLSSLGIPWCTVEAPGNSMADIQIAGEYIVNAIRKMHQRAGRRISIMGHSQGGMSPRWALRFWPDTRAMVDDQIGFAPSNHGTPAARGSCNDGCAPAIWQQRDNAEFIVAVNSGQETFPGISYTEIYTHTDLVVFPNLDDTGSSSLHGGGGAITNVATQDVCPLDLYDHNLIGTVDPVAAALAIDALTNGGPADPSRISASVCLQLLMPGINPLTFATDIASAGIVLGESLLLYPHVSSEPPLACYVTAGCPTPGGGVGGALSTPGPKAARKKKCKRKRGHKAAKRRGCKKKKRSRRR